MKNTLYFLDWDTTAVRVLDLETGNSGALQEGLGGNPDGIWLDEERGKVYWTNMGPDWNAADGSIDVANIDGSDHQQLVGGGAVVTPKQICLDEAGDWLYFCDREAGRVMRCRIDGSDLTTLVETAPELTVPKPEIEQCVGIALDEAKGMLYWTQKGPTKGNQGRILCAPIELAKGEEPGNRSDIVTLLSELPEPIDLELDLNTRTLYWTDRGDGPRGNSLNRARVTDDGLEAYEIIATGFKEAIGLDIDYDKGLAYVSDLTGHIYEVELESGIYRELYNRGQLTGIKLRRG